MQEQLAPANLLALSPKCNQPMEKDNAWYIDEDFLHGAAWKA